MKLNFEFSVTKLLSAKQKLIVNLLKFDTSNRFFTALNFLRKFERLTPGSFLSSKIKESFYLICPCLSFSSFILFFPCSFLTSEQADKVSIITTIYVCNSSQDIETNLRNGPQSITFFDKKKLNNPNFDINASNSVFSLIVLTINYKFF